LCLGSEIGEKVKSWFWRNLGGKLSQMNPKLGVKSLVAKGIDLGWVWLRQVGWIGFLCLGSNISEKVKSWFLSNLGGEFSQMHSK